MSRAHSLLTKSRWEGTSVAELVAEELGPYQRDGRLAAVGGPETVLAAKAALSLSLALHELATNAAKYGAFSTAEGRVDVRWEPTATGGLRLTWQESGGPRVVPPTRRGFGSTLIERALAMEGDGTSSIALDPSGVTCEVKMPASTIVRGPMAAPAVPTTSGPAAELDTLQASFEAPTYRALVVEDSSLVILQYEELFEDMGWTIVGPATRVAQALTLAESGGFDVAVLDVNLNGEMSWDVAERLKERGIPFIFTTGYDGGTVLPPAMATAPVVGKPFAPEVLKQRLRAIVGRAVGPD